MGRHEGPGVNLGTGYGLATMVLKSNDGARRWHLVKVIHVARF
jgi:hypothetical protein